jgi:hypothetical protein
MFIITVHPPRVERTHGITYLTCDFRKAQAMPKQTAAPSQRSKERKTLPNRDEDAR